MYQWRTLVTVTASCGLIASLALAQSGGQPGKGSQPSGAVTPAPAKPGTPMPATPAMPSGQASDPMKGPKSTPGMADSDVRAIQEALKSKGQDPGPIDGLMGPQTQAALKNFQKAENLPMTGRGDSQTLDKLGVKK